MRTVYQLWLDSNICMHCRVYRTHQDFQSHGCSVHMICHDLWTVLLVGVGGALHATRSWTINLLFSTAAFGV